MRLTALASLGLVTPLAAASSAAAQGSMADRIVNDPRADSLNPYGLRLAPKGVAERDYAPRALNAALHLDSIGQVLDIGPVYVLDYGQTAQ